MKPTEIKKINLSLNKSIIANLSVSDMSKVIGGVATKPGTIVETVLDCPCTHFCEPATK
jgi:hypothetical protein